MLPTKDTAEKERKKEREKERKREENGSGGGGFHRLCSKKFFKAAGSRVFFY